MADSYLEFSEVLPRLTAEEQAWLQGQLQCVYVFGDREYPEDELPDALDPAGADWYGCRAWRDLQGNDADADDGSVGFEHAFRDGCDAPDGWGRHVWLYADESADLDRIAHLVQQFLRRFRPRDCWSLTYAMTCSKPRAGQFGGGAVFVTADEVKWQNAHDFVEAQSAAFRRKTAPDSVCSENAVQAYELAIGGPQLRAQRGLLLRLAEGLHRGKRPQLGPDDAEPLEGLINLTDAIADQATDRYGIDCLLPAENPSYNERLVGVEMLAAYENRVWDTIPIQVPVSVAFDDEELNQRAIADYVEANLAGQAQYRHVVAWAFYRLDEDPLRSAEEEVP